jgi:hypothetical protein
MTEEIQLIGFDLSGASDYLIELLLDDPPGPEIYREILDANRGRPEILRLLLEHHNTPDEISAETQRLLSPTTLHAEHEHVVKAKTAPVEEERKQRLLQRIQSLTVGEKIALALRGGREVRSILCKDSNKEVVLSVIKNPKVTDSEAELIAHSRNIPEEALRVIAKNREWMKNYNVVLALVNNPKTPTGIAMNLVPGLKKKDLATLEKNKNVPEAVRVIAKKLVAVKKYS